MPDNFLKESEWYFLKKEKKFVIFKALRLFAFRCIGTEI